MAEKIRVRCPLCRYMTDFDRWQEEFNVSIDIFKQLFGGKVAGAKKKAGRGRAPGFMKYEELSDEAILDEFKQLVKNRIKKILSEL